MCITQDLREAGKVLSYELEKNEEEKKRGYFFFYYYNFPKFFLHKKHQI